MTIEEKAKAYDEALKIARCWLNDPQTIQDCNYTIEDAIQNIFPELRESEDEKIWQWIREHINHDGTNMFDKAVAWLEKQKEQKPIFRVGDNIIAKDGTCIPKEPFHIEKIEDDCYWDGNGSILVCNQDDFQLIDQQPAEWSEEDKKILYAIELHVGQLNNGETINGFSSSDMLRVLKSIREQLKKLM